MTEDEQLEKFLSLGFYLIPCYSVNPDGSCTCGSPHQGDPNSRGKHPMINEWQKSASNDRVQIDEWNQQFTKINWAVFLKASGLMVLDVDPRSLGDRSFHRLESDFADVFPATYQVLSGLYTIGNLGVRGWHQYFRVPEDAKIKASLGKEMPGIDLKWNGYVLLPGSRHFSGVTYEAAENSPPLSAIADLPPEMLEAFSKPSRRRSTSSSRASFSNRATPYGAKALGEEAKAISATMEGDRNNTVFRKGIAVSELIAGGELPPAAIGVFAAAAEQSGLSEEEIEKVLFRPGGALEIGLSQPRSSGSQELSTRGVRDLELTDSWEEDFLSRVEPVNWAEAFEAEWEEDWFVRGLIARGRSHAIYSEPGLGKSVLSRQMCAELCAHQIVLGTRAYKEPIKVLFFDHENTIIQDVVPQLRALGYSAEQLDLLVYLSFPEMRELDTEEGGKQFEALLDHHKPDLVVLDTVSRTISQDENQNQTWLDFYRYAGVQLKSRGIAYIRLDHTGKNVERGMRGGSAKKGDVDLVWLLSEGRTPGRLALTCEKSRIPLERKHLEIIRELDPFYHTLVIPPTRIDWDKIAESAATWIGLWDFLKQAFEKEGKLPGSKSLWESHIKELQEMGITKRLLEQAHRDFRAGKGPLDP